MPDDVLTAERAHLAAARDALAAMRHRVERLDAVGGNDVSTEYLKAALYHRAMALADDPATPPFFGRIDMAEPETFHIGRRHINDADGDPLVVDWRADVSRAFYRARPSESMGVAMRRRFGFHHGELTAYEDERLDAVAEPAHSAIVDEEIERPRVGPMRDIVATIQPEQDVLVRADLGVTLCVQGAPGTGKTAVGLHRAAYLLYAHRDRLRRSGVLVIGPSASFLRYIRDVLPALGEIDAAETTADEVVAGSRTAAGVDAPGAAALKGDVRLADVLRRAVWRTGDDEPATLEVPRGSRVWRVPASEIRRAVAELRTRGVRYGAARAMLAQRLAHLVLTRMEAAGESPDDRVQDAVARSRPVRVMVDAMWPKQRAESVLFELYADREQLAAAADGILDDTEQSLLGWSRAPRSAGRARWTVADLVLLDELDDLLERTPSVGHVVLDEAQDLSPMQLRAVGRRCATGSATVLGDLAQGTTAWASASWADTLQHLGKPDAVVEELTMGFRVPRDVLAYATRLLPEIAPGLAPPTSHRAASGDLTVEVTTNLVAATVDAVHTALARAGSVGVIVADDDAPDLGTALAAASIDYTLLGAAADADARLDLVPARLAKGLEFDHVVVVEPAAIVAAEPDVRTGLRRLYVCLTRAVTSLAVVHAAPLPDALTVR